MCRKVARILRSSCPRLNSSAVNPLMTMPAPAVIITGPGTSVPGSNNRCTASTAMAPEPISSTTALASAARIENRPQP